jgi:hypothetical protein
MTSSRLFGQRTTSSGSFKHREQIAPRKLKQRELNQREQQRLLKM